MSVVNFMITAMKIIEIKDENIVAIIYYFKNNDLCEDEVTFSIYDTKISVFGRVCNLPEEITLNKVYYFKYN